MPQEHGSVKDAVAPIATLPHCFASHAVWLLPPCLFSWALAGKPARLDAKAKALAFFLPSKLGCCVTSPADSPSKMRVIKASKKDAVQTVCSAALVNL